MKYLNNMPKFYHGSHRLFDTFDLSHALEGDGKVKFGFGVYVTSKYESAVHYSASNKSATEHYVYTLELPEKTEQNHIAFKQKVNSSILAKTEKRLGHSVPAKYIEDGKDFRKYLAKELTGHIDIEGEKAASRFLVSVGVIFICWPYSWKNPSLGENMAVLDESVIRIVKVEKVNPEKR